MSRLWTCGYELGTVAALMEFEQTSGAVAIIESTIHRPGGSFSAKFIPAGSSSSIHIINLTASTSGLYSRLYIYVTTFPSSGGNVPILRHMSGASIAADIGLDSTGILRVYDGSVSAGTLLGTAASAISLNTWYGVELKTVNGAAIECEGRYWNATNEDTSTTATIIGNGAWTLTSVGTVRWGVCTGSAANGAAVFYIDDVAINHTLGSPPNDAYPFVGRTAYLRPDSAGDSNTWQTSAGGAGSSTNWQAVDEVTPDDATTYLKRIATTIKSDYYHVESGATKGIGSTDTIKLVSVGVRAGATLATPAIGRQITLGVKAQASGTASSSAGVNIATASTFSTNGDGIATGWMMYKHVLPLSPQTSAAWTPAEIETLQIGMDTADSSTTEVRVSAIWAIVEYIPAAAAATSIPNKVVQTNQAVQRSSFY